MSVWLILIATGLYLAALLVIAWRGDRDGRQASPTVYALALGVYCTSWTYYGAVGTAASEGWDFLPIYLGPVLVFLFLPGMVRRVADAADREGITSLSDFLSARYGKSRSVAALVTIGACAGALPYIALQLKSVSTSFRALAAGDAASTAAGSGEPMLIAALAMAGFAVLFGARSSDTTRRNAGLLRLLAFESVIKVAILLGVGVISFLTLQEGAPEALGAAAARFAPGPPSARFVTITLLSMAAILCLPRQFHIAVIERRGPADSVRARWLFPAYLAATSIAVVPITLHGLSALPAGVPADLYVLALPLSEGQAIWALIVFLGGLSAAMGMIVVAAIALSTMVTNDLVVPALMRIGKLDTVSGAAGAKLLGLRRGVILALVLLAYLYAGVAASEALARIGLLSFAAVAQFAPALIGAVFWQGARARGVLAGVAAGMALWAYTLLLPTMVGVENVADAVPSFLRPNALFGLAIADPLTHGVLWSLGTNILLFVAVSLGTPERLRDRVQAAVFVGRDAPPEAISANLAMPSVAATPNALFDLAARFLNRGAVEHAFAQFAQDTGVPVTGGRPADWRLVQRTERLLASALGASSARIVMSTALGGSAASLDDVLTILDQGTQAERFERHMLQSMLEHMSQGISVVDGDQRLVAWNGAYVDIFGYPPDLVRVGQPIARLIAHNIWRGWLKDADPGTEAARRIAHMREGRRHHYERPMPDGRYLRIVGSPMPGGGYVTTFTDITADKAREEQLIEAKTALEGRVRERTADLETMARQLDAARRDAESANASKTRFLAAASHDLLQPLNAARLFLGAASESNRADLIEKADRAIQSADGLIKGLLDISRLDHGAILPKAATLPVAPLLEDLVEEATPMALAAGLSLRVVESSLTVTADPDFLASILRNFISNARRYTERGGVVVGARRRGDSVRIEVWDTGPGIGADERVRLFDEFERFAEADNVGVRGAGLGLSVAQRLAGLMGARIDVRSLPERGSCFAVTVPGGPLPREARRPFRQAAPLPGVGLAGLHVLCVDDEPSVREAMQVLLTGWGCRVAVASSPAEARDVSESLSHPPDAILVDLALGAGEDGLDVVAALRAGAGPGLPAALLSARVDEAAAARASAMGIVVMMKPVSPGELRKFLGGVGKGAGRVAAE